MFLRLRFKLGHFGHVQRLYGYKTLNLLNSHEDPSFLSTVRYSHLARQHIPAPKANFVKVVLNGESRGIYVNTQQFNKEFVVENYKSSKGARWKARGPGGGGLDYLGDANEKKRILDDRLRRDGDQSSCRSSSPAADSSIGWPCGVWR